LSTTPIFSEPELQLMFAHVAQGSGYWTGLAIFNPGLAAATVTIEVSAANGTPVNSKTVTINAGQRVVGLLTDLFPGFGDQIGGFVRVTSNVPVYGLQMFGSAGTGNFLANIPPGVF